jgi:hypothetical protein
MASAAWNALADQRQRPTARLVATCALVSVGADGVDGWRVDPAELVSSRDPVGPPRGWLVSLVYGLPPLAAVFD